MNKSANMYGLLKVAAPIYAEGNGTANLDRGRYLSEEKVSDRVKSDIVDGLNRRGYDANQVLRGIKHVDGSVGMDEGHAFLNAARDAVSRADMTAQNKSDLWGEIRRRTIGSYSNFAYNPYGVDKLRVEGTGKTVGEVMQGWAPAKPRTFDANHNQTFGAPPLVQAPKVKSAAVPGIPQPQPINYDNTARPHGPIPGVPVDTAESLYQEREKRLTPWRKLAVGAADTAMGALPGIGNVYRGLRFVQDSNIAGRNTGSTAKDFADAVSPDAYKHFRDRVVKRPSLYEQSFNPGNAFAR